MKNEKQYCKKKYFSVILRLITFFFAVITFFTLLFIILYILIRGIPHLKISLFSWKYTTENVSLLPALINTVIITLFALIVSVPLGISTAIYLTEYSRKNSKMVKIIRTATQTLAGFPSIVYGLFGFMFFVIALRWGYSVLAGSLTVSFMILPLIIRTSEEAILAVPKIYKEGSFALGAGKVSTVFLIILPAASPGIFAGIILGIGRIVGETAALVYSSGTVAQIPSSLMSSGRTLAVHMYSISSEGLYINQASATAVVLLVLVAGINSFAGILAKKIGKNL